MSTNIVVASGKRILIVDDEEMVRESVKWLLESEGYEVSLAANGLVAQEILKTEPYSLVLSDINMGEAKASGIELLQAIRRTSTLPVILMTGFSQILEVQEAHRIGANGFLPKPFKNGDLLKLIRTCCELPTKPQSTASEDLDQKYCKLSIGDFVSGKQIQFPIFVRISKTKYVKIAHHGEDIQIDHVHKYLSIGVKFLYLAREDFYTHLSGTLLLSKTALKGKDPASAEMRQKILKSTSEAFEKYLQSPEIDSERLSDARVILENSVQYLSEDKYILDLLLKMQSSYEPTFLHGVGVSAICIMIARQLGWNSHNTLFKVAIVGLLHNVGLTEIDRSIVMTPKEERTQDQKGIIETHPALGAELLAAASVVPRDSSQIVLHHHERPDGNGYPSRIHKTKIHPLASLVAVADEFCQLFISHPKALSVTPVEALTKVSITKGDNLDAECLKALHQIIRPTVSSSQARSSG